MDTGKACPGSNGYITQYKINFSPRSYLNVNLTACTVERCGHTFNLLNDNATSRYDNVSVAAENLVGVGTAKACATLSISECNYANLLKREFSIEEVQIFSPSHTLLSKQATPSQRVVV